MAGHSGLVGSGLVSSINDSAHTWVGLRSQDLDLTDASKVRRFVDAESPDVVVIAAARVGGIWANKSRPYEFLKDNLELELAVLGTCLEISHPKVVFLSSSCVYPKYSPQPIREEFMLKGELEETNKSYALAKIVGHRIVEIAVSQGLDWMTVLPTNVYGVEDNFDAQTSHVLPALVQKFVQAHSQNEQTVELWGDGTPLREFIHNRDLGDALLTIATSERQKYNEINVGTGHELSVSELADAIALEVGYTGHIHWRPDMPNGTPRKLLDSTRIRELGWKSRVSLQDGLSQVVSSRK